MDYGKEFKEFRNQTPRDQLHVFGQDRQQHDSLHYRGASA